MKGEFEGKVAAVTGATGAIGQAVAHSLAQRGATLCLIARDERKLDAASLELETVQGSLPATYSADFTRADDLERVAAAIEERFRDVHVLVHCAGTIRLSPLSESSVGEFDLQYQVNVRAPFLLTQAMLPMLKRSAGQVVFVNSTAGLVARPGVGSYSAAKHALKALADTLRDEVNADGIRVLSVFLGRTASPMQEYVHTAEGKRYNPDRLVQPDDVATMIVHALSLPRTAEVTEIRIRPLASPVR